VQGALRMRDVNQPRVVCAGLHERDEVAHQGRLPPFAGRFINDLGRPRAVRVSPRRASFLPDDEKTGPESEVSQRSNSFQDLACKFKSANDDKKPEIQRGAIH
jgi:hypothetical protein